MHRTIAEIDPCASRQCSLTAALSPLRYVQPNYRVNTGAGSITYHMNNWRSPTSLQILTFTRDYAKSRRRFKQSLTRQAKRHIADAKTNHKHAAREDVGGLHRRLSYCAECLVNVLHASQPEASEMLRRLVLEDHSHKRHDKMKRVGRRCNYLSC